MHNALKMLKLCPIIFLVFSGCITAPEIEVCVIGSSGCVCHDPRLASDKQDYVRTFSECVNYFATNQADFATLEEYCKRGRN